MKCPYCSAPITKNNTCLANCLPSRVHQALLLQLMVDTMREIERAA